MCIIHLVPQILTHHDEFQRIVSVFLLRISSFAFFFSWVALEPLCRQILNDHRILLLEPTLTSLIEDTVIGGGKTTSLNLCVLGGRSARLSGFLLHGALVICLRWDTSQFGSSEKCVYNLWSLTLFSMTVFIKNGVGGGSTGGGIVSITACEVSIVELDAPSVNRSVNGWSQSGRSRVRVSTFSLTLLVFPKLSVGTRHRISHHVLPLARDCLRDIQSFFSEKILLASNHKCMNSLLAPLSNKSIAGEFSSS